ncbi:discoidin domain-containing protein, partial [Streptomyces sp. NPDC099088]|uniref:discoidin domain-containing protein n=1 Tax=Streptomyces sp. NPDC099088 TaxID=3366101 RepID=UPI00381C9F74
MRVQRRRSSYGTRPPRGCPPGRGPCAPAPADPVGSVTSVGGSSVVNVALNRPVSAGSYAQSYAPGNAVDGNVNTYWESANSAFPQWLQVD